MSGTLKVVWGITGAGDYLVESLDAMRNVRRELGADVTVLLSKNGELAVRWHYLWDELNSSFHHVKSERGLNRPIVAGPLQLGHYAIFFVSPVTGNTAAKIAHGIADSLISNRAAQTIKGGTPVYVYPVDQRPGSQLTEGPQGAQTTFVNTKLGLENVKRLRNIEGRTV